MSPVWLSLTLNWDTWTPATLVFTAVITVPVVLALPVLIEESPTLYEVLLVPVFVLWFNPFETFALLFWEVLLLFVKVALALLVEEAPLFELVSVALPFPLPPEVEILLLPIVVEVAPLFASPVVTDVDPT